MTRRMEYSKRSHKGSPKRLGCTTHHLGETRRLLLLDDLEESCLGVFSGGGPGPEPPLVPFDDDDVVLCDRTNHPVDEDSPRLERMNRGSVHPLEKLLPDLSGGRRGLRQRLALRFGRKDDS